MRYVIIDVMENKYYGYVSGIEMGFSLDSILSERDRLEIPYRLIRYNGGNVVVIKGV